MLASVGLFESKQEVETKGVVLGICDVFGIDDGAFDLRQYAQLVRDGRERLDDSNADEIASAFLDNLDKILHSR